MMAKIVHDTHAKDDIVYTFANTGREMPETLDFVEECAQRWSIPVVWIEYEKSAGFKIVDHKTAARNGEPFAEMLSKKKMLPNVVTRFCTTELKIRPMKKYLMSIGWKHWDCAVGIRYDERNRYERMKAQQGKNRWDYIFPLWDFRVTKLEVYEFWKNQPFDLKISSELGNCDFCFMKGLQKKIRQAKLMPDRLDWWIDMENRSNGATFHKDFKISTLKKLSENPTLFEYDLGCFCGD